MFVHLLFFSAHPIKLIVFILEPERNEMYCQILRVILLLMQKGICVMI